MAKAGDEYQSIVGAVAKALDPGYSVKVGQWIEGPDGKRDLDVEVRGVVAGRNIFILIECKDWKQVVGIEVVDALDSKRRDLGADRVIIYSNSGFSKPALRKALRMGIEMASALMADGKKIRVQVHRRVIARHLLVSNCRAVIYPSDTDAPTIPDSWNLDALRHDGLPVINWVSRVSLRLLEENEDAREMVFRCSFQQSPKWTYDGKPVSVGAVELALSCSKRWVEQTVKVDVSLGTFDYLRKAVVVPDQQIYKLGPIDNHAWGETDERWEEKDPEPGTFEFRLTLFEPVPPIRDARTPELDDLIAQREVRIVSATV